jgi:hypothetical protein
VTTQWTGQDCCDQVGACEEGTEVQLIPVLNSQHTVGGEWCGRDKQGLTIMENLFSVNTCYVFAVLRNISADSAIPNMAIHQNKIFIKQRDVILINDAWTVIVNLDFRPYEQKLQR